MGAAKIERIRSLGNCARDEVNVANAELMDMGACSIALLGHLASTNHTKSTNLIGFAGFWEPESGMRIEKGRVSTPKRKKCSCGSRGSWFVVKKTNLRGVVSMHGDVRERTYFLKLSDG